MPINLVLDNLDNVEDALKPFYVEHDGKFHLDTVSDSVRAHRDVTPLANAYERTKGELATVKESLTIAQKRAAPEGFDADAWKAWKEGKPDAQTLQQMAQLRQTLEGERDEWKGKYEQSQTAIRQAAIERDLSDAITAAGISNPSFAKAARALLAPRVDATADAASLDIGLGPMPISDAVKRWAAQDEGKAFVTPPSGDGARGQSGNAGKQSAAKFNGNKSERLAAIQDMMARDA